MLSFWLGCSGGAVVPGEDDTGPRDTADTEPLVAGEDCGDAPWGDLPDRGDTVWVLAGEHGDGTRDAPFGTIEEALAAGSGTVGVGEGRYPAFTVSNGPVTILGRCTSLVHLEGGDLAAVTVAEGGDLTLEGVAVTGGTVGVEVTGGRLSLDHVGIDGVAGDGLRVSAGEATATWTSWSGVEGAGVRVSGPGSVSLEEEIVIDGSGGGGLVADGGAQIRAFQMDVDASVGVGIVAAGEGTLVQLEDSWIDSTARGTPPWMGSGAVVFDGGSLVFGGGGIRQASGPLLGVYTGGSVACDACSLTDGYFSVVVVAGGTVELTNAQVTGGFPDSQLGGGMSVYATGGYGDNRVTLTSTFVDVAPHAAIWVDGPGAYQVTDSTVMGVLGYDVNGSNTGGNAIYAEGVDRWDGATGLSVSGSTIQGAPNVAVLFQDAAGTFSGNTWSGNGTDVLQQRCDTIAPLADDELDGANASVCPDGNRPVDVVVLDPRLVPEDGDL